MRPAAITIGLIAAVLLAGSPSAGASELLANGGFEQGSAGWSFLGGSLTELDAVSAPVHGGALAGRFSGSGQPTTQIVYQSLSVQPNQSYELSGWTAASGVNGAFLRISWFDSNGALLPPPEDSPGVPARDGNFYFLATGSRVSPAAARLARASLYVLGETNTPFTVHLDDFTFTGPAAIPPPSPTSTPAPAVTPTPPAPTATPGGSPKPVPSPTGAPAPQPTPPGIAVTPTPAVEPDVFPRLVNGGFEELRGDGTPYGWHKQGGVMSTATDRRTEGARALRLSSSTTSTKWAYQTVAAEGGAYYEATVHAYAGPGSESAFLRLSWYASVDGSGSAISSTDSHETIDAAFRPLTTGPVQAPAGAQSAKLRLMLRPSSEEPGTAYFDAVAFGQSQPSGEEIVRGPAGVISVSGEDSAWRAGGEAGVGGSAGATPATLANVKPPPADTSETRAAAERGRDDWAILLAMTIAVAAVGMAGGYELWQRRYRRHGRGDEP